MMTYELAKQLKDAGFQQIIPGDNRPHGGIWERGLEGEAMIPTLSELIDACGADFKSLRLDRGGWIADASAWLRLSSITGSTAEQVMAELWLAINKK